MDIPELAVVYQFCPNLKNTPHRKASNRNGDYNCLAFALGVRDRWWDPFRQPRDRGVFAHWPDGCPGDGTLEDAICAYESEGYERCTDGTFESGYEKAALFVDGNSQVVHAAWQPSNRNGLWKSKIGELQDVEHQLEAVESDVYGTVAAFMRRAVRNKRASRGA